MVNENLKTAPEAKDATCTEIEQVFNDAAKAQEKLQKVLATVISSADAQTIRYIQFLIKQRKH